MSHYRIKERDKECQEIDENVEEFRVEESEPQSKQVSNFAKP